LLRLGQGIAPHLLQRGDLLLDLAHESCVNQSADGLDIVERVTDVFRIHLTGQLLDLQNAGALSGPFDTAFAFGVLHHLPDDAIPALGALLTRVLRPGGTFVSIDPCHVDTQPIWSKCLMAFDRGRHIRTEEGYRQVLGAWGKPSTSTTLDMLRIRYAMAICRVNLAVPDVSRV